MWSAPFDMDRRRASTLEARCASLLPTSFVAFPFSWIPTPSIASFPRLIETFSLGIVRKGPRYRWRHRSPDPLFDPHRCTVAHPIARTRSKCGPNAVRMRSPSPGRPDGASVCEGRLSVAPFVREWSWLLDDDRRCSSGAKHEHRCVLTCRGSEAMVEGGGSATWWWMGIGMNVVGSVGINLGTCLMKRGHNHRECRANHSGMPAEPVRSHKSWQFGATLFALGNVMNFISFGYAAQSLLSALGSVQFVSNVIFAHFLLGEEITSQVITGTSIIIGGNLLLVIYGNHQSRVYTAQELISFYEEIGYQRYVACLLVISTLSYMFYSRGRNKMKRMMVRDSAAMPALYRKGVPLCFALAAATIGTQSVIFGKSLSTLLRAAWSGIGYLTSWLTGVLLLFLLCTSVFWMVMLNKALRVFDAVVIVPLMQICWIFFSILGGLVYFREYEDFHLLQVYVWLVGCCFILLGVHLLTPPADRLSGEQELDEETSFMSSQGSEPQLDTEPTSPSKLGAFAKAAGKEAEHLFGHMAKDIKLAYNMATGRDHLLPVTIYSISTMEGACTSPHGPANEYSAISSSQDGGSSSHQEAR